MHKEAGRPWPVLSPDPVIDYMLMEAVFLKVQREQKDAETRKKQAEWKTDKEGISALRDKL